MTPLSVVRGPRGRGTPGIPSGVLKGSNPLRPKHASAGRVFSVERTLVNGGSLMNILPLASTVAL
jgi:hypothetical protein